MVFDASWCAGGDAQAGSRPYTDDYSTDYFSEPGGNLDASMLPAVMQACCHHQHPLPRCRRHLLRARRQWNALRHLFLLHWTLGLRASVLGIRPLPSTTRSVATRRLDCRWLLTAPIESSLPSAAPPPTSDARAPRKRPRDKAAPVYNKKRGRRALGCRWPPTSACGTKR